MHERTRIVVKTTMELYLKGLITLRYLENLLKRYKNHGFITDKERGLAMDYVTSLKHKALGA